MERAGLLFRDRNLEVQYLRSEKLNLRSKIAMAALLLLLLNVAIASATAQANANPDNPGPMPWLNALPAALSVCGLCLIAVSTCRTQKASLYRLMTAVSWLSAMAIFFTYLLTTFIWQLECFGGQVNHSTVYSTVYEQASENRRCGLSRSTPFITFLAVAWAAQKILVVFNASSSRVFVTIVPFNFIALLVAFYATSELQFPDPFYGWWDLWCLAMARMALVNIVAQIVIGSAAASIALLWIVLRRAIAARELFVVTRKLRVNVNLLRQEADPFNPENLQRWLALPGASATSSLDESRGDEVGLTASAFWMIPPSDLVLGERIAAGGSGTVWRAFYNARPVAAKQLFASAGFEPDVEELSHEAAVLGQLSHVNVVKFLGLCKCTPPELNGLSAVFIVQEFCARNLRHFIVTDATNIAVQDDWLRTVVGIIYGVANGMAYLHHKDIVHRDLKPENVLMTDDNVVRICDFGISSQRSVAFASTLQTEASLQAVQGTVEYMAPETYVQYLHRTRAECAAEAPVDVYAFGVIMWELLCTWVGNGTPHIDCSEHLMGLRQRSLRRETTLEDLGYQWELPDMSLVASCSPPTFLDMIRRCLHFSAQQRPVFMRIEAELRKECAFHLPPKKTPVLNSTRPHMGATVSLSLPTSGSALGPDKHVELNQVSDGVFTGNTVRSGTESVYVGKVKNLTAWSSACTRCRLHFSTVEAEQNFHAYTHGDRFYAMLKWVYLVLTACYGSYFAAVVFTTASAPGSVNMTSCLASAQCIYWYCQWAPPLLGALLFGCASVFSWQRRGRQHASTVLLVLALLWIVVNFVVSTLGETELNEVMDEWAFTTNWNGLVTPNPNSTWSQDHGEYYCLANGTAVANGDRYCLGTATMWSGACPGLNVTNANAFVDAGYFIEQQEGIGALLYARNYAIYYFEGATVPVILLVLGLPVRLYAFLVVATTVASAIKLGSAFTAMEYLYATAIANDTLDVFETNLTLMLTPVALVVASVAGVNATCIFGAYVQERSRRSMFVLYSSLFSQELVLSRDARFRQYREVMEGHRHEFFAAAAATTKRGAVGSSQSAKFATV